MATVLESILPMRGAFCCALLWAKGLNANDIHKELFPVYGGVRRVKRLTIGWQSFR
jgi:hypothetical protein